MCVCVCTLQPHYSMVIYSLNSSICTPEVWHPLLVLPMYKTIIIKYNSVITLIFLGTQ